MRNRILITGVAGLIGSHLSRYLLDRGFIVVGVDDLSGGYKEFVDPRVVFLKEDLTDASAVKRVFRIAKPDYVYHLAAYAAEGLSPFIRNFNYQSNIIASVNVINECINSRVEKIIFTSSMAVYGENRVPFKETMHPKPVDPYGIAKYAVEMDLDQAFKQFGLRYSIVRPHNVIGIYQNIWDKYRNVIGIWIRRIFNGESITIYGDGEQKRAFSDVSFCLPAFEALLTKGDSEVFNIGSDKEYTINEAASIVSSVASSLGLESSIEHLPERHEVKHAYSGHTRAKRRLNFKDDTDLENTVKEMFEWAKDINPKKLRTMDYEVTKNMYGFW